MNAVEVIAGPVPEISLEYDQILKGGGRFWDGVNGGYLVLTARREGIEWAHSEAFYELVPMQHCKDAGMKLLELIWVDTDKSVDPAHKKIRSRLRARDTKRRTGQHLQSSTRFSIFSAMPPLEAVIVLVSIMMSVGWSS